MSSYRFPKSARLARSSEFRRVREKGETHHGRFLILNVLRTESPDGARFGLITSRRVGVAAKRNRVRRRLREIVRHNREALPRDLWMVLVAKPKAANAEFSELQNDWEKLMVRTGLLPK